MDSVTFLLDGRLTSLSFGASAEITPTTTVLNYLRSVPRHKGARDGCAAGDCGACTIVLGEVGHGGRLHYRAVNSCLLLLPMLHRTLVITVEQLRSPAGDVHPVQQAMLDQDGPLCGFCTPGILLSLLALLKTTPRPTADEIKHALSGNLCRCTGYVSFLEAAVNVAAAGAADHFDAQEGETARILNTVPDESLSIATATQRYLRPVRLAEALRWRAEHPDALVLCGGTDAALQVSQAFEPLPVLLDLSAVREIRMESRDEGGVTIGAGAPLSQVMSLDLPALRSILERFGSQQIRNCATLGGNLGTASPVGDTLPVLTAYRAVITLQSLRGTRHLPIEEFLLGYRRTALSRDELITAVRIPAPSAGTVVKTYKVSRRKDLDIAAVSAGFRLERDGRTVRDITLAYGGVAETVVRASGTEEWLRGRPWDRPTVEAAMAIIDQDLQPISDVRGSAQFRQAAARNMLLKFWSETRAL